MHKILLTILATTIAIAVSATASAGVRDPHINKQQRHQATRIGQGIKSGELTKGESKDLVQEQRQIHQEEHQYKADGQFTQAERKDVRQDQRDASKQIYAEKHDEQERPKAQ
jgi:hypothetical protein